MADDSGGPTLLDLEDLLYEVTCERDGCRAREAALRAKVELLKARGSDLVSWIAQGCGAATYKCSEGWEEPVEAWEEARDG